MLSANISNRHNTINDIFCQGIMLALSRETQQVCLCVCPVQLQSLESVESKGDSRKNTCCSLKCEDILESTVLRVSAK